MQFFDGNKHAKILDQKIQKYISSSSVDKSLAIVLIGDDPASEKYVGIKRKLCNVFGINIDVHIISESLSDETIFQKVRIIFDDERVGGGIIQLPLPRKSLNEALSLIPVEKDIDLISPESQRIFYSGDFSRLSPVVRALEYFVSESNINLRKIKAGVIGDGYLVGRPISHYFLNRCASVDLIGGYNGKNTLNYQLLVLSAGVPLLVKGQNVSNGCHVIDYGSTVIDNRVVGDLDLNTNLDHLGLISPSPGGVGPLVTRFLLMNFLGM